MGTARRPQHDIDRRQAPRPRDAAPVLPPAGRPLSILLIHLLFETTDDPGGTRHYDLVRGLAGRGHRVTVLTGTTFQVGGKPRQPGTTVWPRRAGGYVRMVVVPSLGPYKRYISRLGTFLTFSAYAGAVTLSSSAYDVLWLTAPPALQHVIPALAAQLRGIPFVYEVRDPWTQYMQDLGLHPMGVRALKYLDRFVELRAREVLATAPSTATALLAEPRLRGRVHLAPTSVDVDAYADSPPATEARAALKLPERFTVMFTGSHGILQSLETIVDAALLLRGEPVEFVFVGDGGAKADTVARTKALGLDNVRFIDPQPKSMMPLWVAASDVGVATLRPLPSLGSTYPRKLFDFMAGGRPVIAALHGDAAALVRSHDTGLVVPPGEPAALVGAIRVLAADPEYAAACGRRGRELMVAQFSRAAQVGDIEAVLLSAARCEG